MLEEGGDPSPGVLGPQHRREVPALDLEPFLDADIEPVVDRRLRHRLGHRCAPGELGGERDGREQHLGVGYDPVHEPEGEGLVGVHLATGQDQVLRPRRTDEARQALGPAAAGDNPEQHFGLPELGALTADAKVAGEGELEAPAQRVAVDRRDGDPRQGGQRAKCRMEVGGDLVGLDRAELGDIGPGREDALTAGDDDRAGRVGGQVLDHGAELVEHLGRQGVGAWAVEADHRHAVGAALQGHEPVVSHMGKLPDRATREFLPPSGARPR